MTSQARTGGDVSKSRHRRAGRTAAVAGALGIALLAAACSSSGGSGGGSGSGAATLNGAGSTFAAPMYQQWAGEYNSKVNKNVQINYQAIGSGGGISEFTQGIVDFGATDAPMSANEQSAAQSSQGSTVLHLPMILGAVAIIYNLPGVSKLTLDGPALASIYLGKITKWNDPAIKKLNPGVTLPSAAIQPVQRADSSGTSYVVTSYFSAISPAWASQVGVSKAPSWPTGTGATGSSGVAAAVSQTKDSIGYVELGYATSGKIPFASLMNASGKAVAPSTTSVEAAAAGATLPTDITALKLNLVNQPGAGAYPLSTATYILVAQAQKDANKGKALKAWLLWCLKSPQQAESTKLNYAPLPTALDKLVVSAVNSVK